MKFISLRLKIEALPANFRRMYPDPRFPFSSGLWDGKTAGDVLQSLQALDLTKAKPEDLEPIIDRSWFWNPCDECGNPFCATVVLFQDFQVFGRTFPVCSDCLEKAAALIPTEIQ